jgi:hypothetical protein
MWREIRGYQYYYEINEQGEVRSRDRFIHIGEGKFRFYKGRMMKIRINNRGYREVRLSISGRTRTHFLHRLLAEIFIPNPDNKPYVNHKNGCKTDNSIKNLEWVTHSENVRHAYMNALYSNKRAKYYNSNTTMNVESGQIFFSQAQAVKNTAQFLQQLS